MTSPERANAIPVTSAQGEADAGCGQDGAGSPRSQDRPAEVTCPPTVTATAPCPAPPGAMPYPYLYPPTLAYAPRPTDPGPAWSIMSLVVSSLALFLGFVPAAIGIALAAVGRTRGEGPIATVSLVVSIVVTTVQLLLVVALVALLTLASATT